jgi:hypothetical protein
MSCSEWKDRIAAGAGAEHLATCTNCRTWVDDLEKDLMLLRLAHEDALDPAHFRALRAHVLDQVRRERGAPVWRWIPLAAAAALVALLLVWPRQTTPVRLPPPAPRARTADAPPPQVAEVPRRAQARVRRARRPLTRHPVTPLVVKMLTDDPDVVVYWILDAKGD